MDLPELDLLDVDDEPDPLFVEELLVVLLIANSFFVFRKTFLNPLALQLEDQN